MACKMTTKELLDRIPKRKPKWDAKYPCPKEITLYRSAISMRSFKKDFPIPSEPDWDRIFKEYDEAHRT